jgi:lipoprotein-anchoring transpeptidase ErfK/SrfK
MTSGNDPLQLSRRMMLLSGAALLAGCAMQPAVPEGPSPVSFIEGYGPLFDAGYNLPPIPEQYTQGVNRRMTGIYVGEQPPGSIDVDPYAKFLYYIPLEGETIRYPIGAGRAGKSFSGDGVIQDKRMWPSWTPTANMLRNEPEVYGPFADGIPGGLRSPLGARALYLYRNGRDTFYRIHGTNDMTSVGNSGSAGCIRLFNQDVIDLYNRVPTGTRVHVRSEEESLRVDPEYFGRGVEMPPVIIDPQDVYGPEAVAADRPPDFNAVPPLDATLVQGSI